MFCQRPPSAGARTAMSNAVTSGVALVGPTAPCGVSMASTFSGGGSGGGAVCCTLEGGVDPEDIDVLAGDTGAAVCALAAGPTSRAVKAKEVRARRDDVGIAPTAVRAQ